MTIFAKKVRPQKIELYPSDSYERDIVNLISGDLAEVNGTSKSQEIFSCFLQANAPTTDRGMFYLEVLVRDGGSVKNALASLCSKMAAGVNWEPAYRNGYELLEFIDDTLLSNHIRVCWDNEACHHMMDSFARVVDSMSAAANRAKESDSDDRFVLGNEAEYARDLLREFKSGQKEGYAEPAANLTRLFKSNWQTLERNQMVWRCLTSLMDASMCWPDFVCQDGKRVHVRSPRASELRLQTIDLIERITKGWEDEEAEKLLKSGS